MAKWTQHYRYTFHVENISIHLQEELVADLSEKGYCVMSSSYIGAWEGRINDSCQFVWIAPHDEPVEMHTRVVDEIEEFLCRRTGSTCLMPLQDTVNVRCQCQ